MESKIILYLSLNLLKPLVRIFKSLINFRYSDFHALHEKIGTKYEKLASLPFPSKKTFGNMERHVLESRRKMLDIYLKTLLHPDTLRDNFGLVILLQRFLDQVKIKLNFY